MKVLSLEKCVPIPLQDILDSIKKVSAKKQGGIWVIENEIKPADLYCYLYIKFGSPNGIQNILRKDDSSNLIHWDWTLLHPDGIIMILGLNYRTEVHVMGALGSKLSKDHFIHYVKQDAKGYGKEISKFKETILEDWDLFVNPYSQLRKSIDQILIKFDELRLSPDQEKFSQPTTAEEFSSRMKDFNKTADRYDQGAGLAISLRIMLPILAESFVNMLILMLARDEIRNNERLLNAFYRENIDVRVQSLHFKCHGFKDPVKWNSETCQKYNSIVNQRNDLLHGNVSMAKCKFSEVFFNGRVPVFKKYEGMWQQSVGVSINSSGVLEVKSDYKIVDDFIEYVLSCLDPKTKESVGIFLSKRDLGRNRKTNRLGLLFSDHLIDFFLGNESKKPAP